MGFVKGAAVGLAAGVVVTLMGTMLVFVFGITRTGTTAVPGAVEVVNNHSGFFMQTGPGVLVPMLGGALLGGLIGRRRDRDAPHAAT